MQNYLALNKKIMFRVYGVWLLRRIAPSVFFAISFFILAAQLVAESVTVVAVVANTAMQFRGSGGAPGALWYVAEALVRTRTSVQVEVFVAGVMAGLLLWSIKRAIVSYELIRRNLTK